MMLFPRQLLLQSARKKHWSLAKGSLQFVAAVSTGACALSSVSNSNAKAGIMGNPYCLNVKMSIRPDQRETFLKLIKLDQEQSLETEPDCLQFVIGEDVNQPNTFHLHEEYKNLEGFQHHTQTPHFVTWQEFCDTQPWSSHEPVVDFFQGTHAPPKEKLKPIVPAYCLNVNLYPKPEVREEFLKVIANNKQGSDDTEPLCLQYVYGESTETPHTFHFHEEYTGAKDGEEGFEAHANAPHFAAWEAFASTGEPFTKPPVVSFFKTI